MHRVTLSSEYAEMESHFADLAKATSQAAKWREAFPSAIISVEEQKASAIEPAGVHYVYAIRVHGTTRYIGKGCGDRCRQHERIAHKLNVARAEGRKIRTSRFYNRLAKAIRDGRSISAEILVSGLTEDAALEREKIEIAHYRADLWNTFEGGEGATSEGMRVLLSDPAMAKAYKEHGSRQMTARHADPAFAKATKERGRFQGRKRVHKFRQWVLSARIKSEIVRAGWNGPEKRAGWNDPEKRARMLVGLRAGHAPEVQSKRTASIRAALIEKHRMT